MNNRARPHAFSCVVMAATLLVLFAPRAFSQAKHKCDPDLKGVKGSTGYRDRSYACEGMYIGSQSTLLNIQVVSFVRGTLDQVGLNDLLRVVVDVDTIKYGSAVRIIGTGRKDNLHWAIHGVALPDTGMRWPRYPVIKRENLTGRDVGIYGIATPKDGLGDVVLVPVSVFDAHTKSAPQSDALELVLRLPSAGRIRWKLLQSDSASEVRPDAGRPGFFTIRMPADSVKREDVITVEWQRIGTTKKWSAPELLTIYR